MNRRYYFPWIVFILLAAIAIVQLASPSTQAGWFAGLLAFAVVAHGFWLQSFGGIDPFDVDSEMPEQHLDPWEVMRTLMKASGQEIGDRPVLTDTSMLYAALIMEESAETFVGMITVLDSMASYSRDDDRRLAIALRARLGIAATVMDRESRAIRSILEGKSFRMELTEDEAVPIFDGTTDIAVVNCGFALACGLPGVWGYDEVQGSNLSKRNPETGVIDKTPDGKWIKGSEYSEPNLRRVLRQDMARRIESHR